LINLGFITEGKPAAVLITPSLGVPNWSVIYIINTAPPSGKAKSSRAAVYIFTFVFFLLMQSEFFCEILQSELSGGILVCSILLFASAVLTEYISSVVDATVKTGIIRQVDASKA
jgi:hypothetical protein